MSVDIGTEMEPLQGQGPSNNLDKAGTFTPYNHMMTPGRDAPPEHVSNGGRQSSQPGRDPNVDPSKKFYNDFKEAQAEVEARVNGTERPPSKYQLKQEAKNQVEDTSEEEVADETTHEEPIVEATSEEPQEQIVEAKPKSNGLDINTPPAPLTKAEKAAWADWPEEARRAYIKRDQDATKGVDELKQKYQDVDQGFSEIDHHLKQRGLTRGEHIRNSNRFIFGLEGAIDGVRPGQALAALAYAKGISYDDAIQALQHLKQNYPQQQQQGGFVNLAPQDRAALNAASQLQERMNAQAAQENVARLEAFKENHPYFDYVNIQMGLLLAPNQLVGNRSVIPLKNGRPDMETAYKVACQMNPEVQALMAQEKLAKEAKARKQTNGQGQPKPLSSRQSPSGADTRNTSQPARGLSVRDSLKQAIEQHRT